MFPHFPISLSEGAFGNDIFSLCSFADSISRAFLMSINFFSNETRYIDDALTIVRLSFAIFSNF